MFIQQGCFRTDTDFEFAKLGGVQVQDFQFCYTVVKFGAMSRLPA